MKILHETMTLDELKQIAAALFGDFVKAVVDVEKGALAIDAELHSDLETELLQDGSKQENLWGINLYPDFPKDKWIEFDSMINIRPSQGNRSRGVEDLEIRKVIYDVVKSRISR